MSISLEDSFVVIIDIHASRFELKMAKKEDARSLVELVSLTALFVASSGALNRVLAPKYQGGVYDKENHLRAFIYDFCPTLPPPPPPPSIHLNDCFLPYVTSVQVENRIIATSGYNVRLPNRSIVEILDFRNILRQQSSFDAYLKNEPEKRSTNVRISPKANRSYENILYRNVDHNLVLIDDCIRGFKMQTNVFKDRNVSPRWRYMNKRQNRALRAANFREATVLSRTLLSEQLKVSNRYRNIVKKRAIWAHWWFA